MIEKIEKVVLKIEGFLNNLDFFARFAKALGVGMSAFNDQLLNRNKEQLKNYLDARKKPIEPTEQDL